MFACISIHEIKSIDDHNTQKFKDMKHRQKYYAN